MKSYRDLRNDFEKNEKEKKYQHLMKIQENIIRDAVREGRDSSNSRLFVFSDKEYYHGAERDWYDELYKRAKAECENAGYIVKGNLIYF